MALQIIVAVRDRAVDAFGRPFFVPTVGAAIRSFRDEVNNPESPMNKHPEDYDLYELGAFDDATGAMDKLSQPRQVAIGKDCLVKPL